MVGEEFEMAAKDPKTLQENSRALVKAINCDPADVDTKAALAIIARGIDPNMRFSDDNTLLILAALAANNEVMCALLDSGADPNLANIRKETPLHFASRALMKKGVLALLEHGADVFAKSKEGDTPEHCADFGNSGAFGASSRKEVLDVIRDKIQRHWQAKSDAASLRVEIRNFGDAGCATNAEIKPMKRLQVKTPNNE